MPQDDPSAQPGQAPVPAQPSEAPADKAGQAERAQKRAEAAQKRRQAAELELLLLDEGGLGTAAAAGMLSDPWAAGSEGGPDPACLLGAHQPAEGGVCLRS